VRRLLLAFLLGLGVKGTVDPDGTLDILSLLYISISTKSMKEGGLMSFLHSN
jgi:hypothetical protein